MPLTYQGTLTKKVFQTPLAALQYGHDLLDEVARPRRRDLRLAWESFESIEASAVILGEDFDGFWFDIAIEPTDYAMDSLLSWAQTFVGGQLSAFCLKDGAEAEVSVTLPMMGNERFDRPNCDLTHTKSLSDIRVRTAQMHRPGEPNKTRKMNAASRCRQSYHALTESFEDPVPSYELWIATHSKASQYEEQWIVGDDTAKPRGWLQTHDAPSASLDWSSVQSRPRILSGCPTEISCVFPADYRADAVHVWAKWINQLARVDALTLRVRGNISALRTLMDQVDLYHYHPNQASQTFGLTTLHAKPCVDTPTQDTLLKNSALTRRLSDWDIRWSDLHLDIGEDFDQQLGQNRNHYLIRTERSGTVDRMTISLELDDPQDSRFRSAKRHLAGHFGDILGRDTAWEYDGPTLDSPRGRRYQRLQDGLAHLVADIDEHRSDLADAPARTVLDFVPFVGGHHLDGRALIEKFSDAINRGLPGFRYDRRAHVTDKYFLEFVRRTSHGFNMIEIQRYVRPHGFSVRLAVSRFRIPFADLMPGSGRAIPGYIVQLQDLVPERPERWTYKKARRFERVLEDLSLVLEKRAGRFFDRAEPMFAECFNESGDHHDD